MKKRLLATILGLSANLIVMGCADDQARAQIADTNAKLAQLQSTVSNANSNTQISVLNRLDELQSQIEQINGNVDTLDHNQKLYQSTQDQLNQSMEQQIQELAGATGQNVGQARTASAPVERIKPVSSSTVSTEINSKNELNSALKKIKSHNFPAAIKELKTIIKTSSDQEVVADAQYYLAVSYAANAQYTDAIATARKFVTTYPQNKLAPDALRTQYVSQLQLGMKQSAAKTATLLNKNYPDSEANQKIQASLKKSTSNNSSDSSD